MLGCTVAAIAMAVTSTASATRTRGALERYELSTLRIFSISAADASGRRSALIEDAEHFVHLVQPGSYLGTRDGKISEIRASEIVVIEIVPEGASYKESTVVLVCDASCRR